MRINESFPALQGEGFFAGFPVYFVRTSGCNLNCDFCDTKYHKNGIDKSIEEVVDNIRDSKLETIVFTGGEPMLQKNDIFEVMSYLPKHSFHLETNGTLYDSGMSLFDYIGCSPKKEATNNLDSYKKINREMQSTFKFVYENKDNKWWEKFIQDVGIENNKVWIMPEGATQKEQLEKMPEVMEYCLEKGYQFGPRLHVLAYDTKRGV